MRMGWRVGAAGLVGFLLLLAGDAGAQTLARPGWVGSGLQTEVWWRHAVFLSVDVAGGGDPDPIDDDQPVPDGVQRLTARLDELHSLGIDAVVVHGLTIETIAPVAGEALPPEPAGWWHADTLEDVDVLVREAARRHVRVLLELPLEQSGTMTAETAARLWLNHGVAGFDVVGLAGSNEPAAVRLLAQEADAVQRVVHASTGDRIVLAGSGLGRLKIAAAAPAEVAVETGVATRRRHRRRRARVAAAPSPAVAATWQPDLTVTALVGAELKGEKQPLTAAALRARMQTLFNQQEPAPVSRRRTRSRPVAPAPAAVLLAAPDGPAASAMENAVAAAVLTAPGAALLQDQPSFAASGGESAANVEDWYRGLIGLRGAEPALRNGTLTFVPGAGGQDALVWLRQGAGVPVLVVCNLSSVPMHVVLRGDLAKLGIRGTVLRTLLNWNPAPGASETLDDLGVGPDGVWVGEVTGKTSGAELTRRGRR